jgi:hypothetical protein
MKCCICGTVRNCGKYLEKVFSNIEKIGTIFDEYVIIVYYDVSNDNTLEFLKQYYISEEHDYGNINLCENIPSYKNISS